ncbi:MAG: ATP-grasp domain-containing protein [Promethearchaeota archaeon]|nr:MAG: ATP-grasp domain-containing protein [Candidatus Lokiarchaeota archaeon]
MRKKNIFLFEFVSGGGYNNITLPSSLFCEGYSMLKSIIEDFSRLNFETYTLLDERIAFLAPHLNTQNITLIAPNHDFIEKYEQMLLKSDSCFIIAPEFSNILYNLTEIASNHKKEILSVGLEGIKLGASKMRTYEFFKQADVPTPETYLIPIQNNQFDIDFIQEKFEKLNQSVIVKPEDGVGAELIFHITNKSQITQLFKTENSLFDDSRFLILQEFVKGTDMSMSLVGRPAKKRDKPYILSVNTQNILLTNGKVNSQYNGGMTPVLISDSLRKSLNGYLNQLDLSSFRGYFGIDFILTPDNSVKFIEINPRLTTPYLGIRNTFDLNPLKYIIGSREKKIRKATHDLNYVSEYYRLDLKYIGKRSSASVREELTLDLLSKIPELVTPPVLLDQSDSELNSCFIATRAKNIINSQKRKKEIAEILKLYDFIPLN